jgi:hypothetical protein
MGSMIGGVQLVRRFQRQAGMHAALLAARLIIPIAIALLLASAPRPVGACSCVSTSPEQAEAASDAVFTGTVVATAQIPAVGRDDFAGMHDILYTFAVDGVVKGDLPAEVAVVGGSSGASCGMSFAAETRYLVFANLDAGNLVTNLCSGNTELQRNEAGPLPARAPDSPEPRSEPPLGLIIVGGIVLLLASLSAVAFRRSAH